MGRTSSIPLANIGLPCSSTTSALLDFTRSGPVSVPAAVIAVLDCRWRAIARRFDRERLRALALVLLRRALVRDLRRDFLEHLALLLLPLVWQCERTLLFPLAST